MTQGLVHFFPIFWPVRNKTWPSKNFCPPSKNYFEAWKNSKSTSFGLEDPYIIAFIGESPSSLSLPPTYHLVPNQVDSFMFSFNLFLSWHFVQDEDDYSTTIMHPSRNSYTAPAALLNEIAHTAEHVCIYCTFIISCWCMWFLVDKVQLYYKDLPFNGEK